MNGQPTIRCPFHDDTQACGSVHQDDAGNWRYTCHACTWNGNRRSGDVFDLVRRIHGCGFRGALAHLGVDDEDGPGRSDAPPARGDASASDASPKATSVDTIALAVITAGRSAVGITGGEATELPGELVGLLRGREVAAIP